ncbi:MAG: hypothetical protein ACPGXK_03820 [Phycisphaerae bacterium]
MTNEGEFPLRLQGTLNQSMVQSIRESVGLSPEVIELPNGSSVVFSEDCQHVLWPDPEQEDAVVPFVFNSTQARAVAAMRDNSRENVLLGERRLLEIMGVSTGPDARFSKYFRQSGQLHPAFHRMIRSAGRGQSRVWGLYPPIGGRSWQEITHGLSSS